MIWQWLAAALLAWLMWIPSELCVDPRETVGKLHRRILQYVCFAFMSPLSSSG